VRDVLNELRGARVEEIAQRIAETTDATASRARLIARDQTLKLNAEITEARHRAAGVTEYVWRSSRDERTRERHKELDGTRHRYSDPPVIDERTGRRGNPGDDYQCRCTADPVITGFDA
jgi:SPP1 gp7 family putative phage head morphogenesis protein